MLLHPSGGSGSQVRPIVSRRVAVFVGIVVGVVITAYAVLSAFARQPLSPSQAAAFAAAVLDATPAHLGRVTGVREVRNPFETLRVGGRAFGSPVKTFTITGDGYPYTLPLPPHTTRAESPRQTQRFITFASNEELNEYFVSTLPRAGWPEREELRLGSMRVLNRRNLLLSVSVKFELGTGIRELDFPPSARVDRSVGGPPIVHYPDLVPGPALRARLAELRPDSARPLGVHQPSELLDAARRVVDFLRGDAAFDQIRLAHTVTLYLGPEAGGVRREVGRAMLRNPRNWKVRVEWVASRGHDYSFVPPQGRRVIMTRVGRHIPCRDLPLSSIAKELARFPHVGVQLIPVEMGSCLQAWSFTLIFDPDEKPPTLVAVVYDQFEW